MHYSFAANSTRNTAVKTLTESSRTPDLSCWPVTRPGQNRWTVTRKPGSNSAPDPQYRLALPCSPNNILFWSDHCYDAVNGDVCVGSGLCDAGGRVENMPAGCSVEPVDEPVSAGRHQSTSSSAGAVLVSATVRQDAQSSHVRRRTAGAPA